MTSASFDVDQGAVIDQARQIAGNLRHEGLAEARALLANYGYDAMAEADRIDALAASISDARTARSRGQRGYELESAEVRAEVEAAEKWLSSLSALLEMGATRGPVSVAASEALISKYAVDAGTQRDTAFSLDHAVAALRELPDPAALHITPAFIEKGAQIAKGIIQNQAEAAERANDRVHAAQLVHFGIADLKRAADRLETARRVVELMHGVVIKGFDYAILRAAAAPRPSSDGEPDIGS